MSETRSTARSAELKRLPFRRRVLVIIDYRRVSLRHVRHFLSLVVCSEYSADVSRVGEFKVSWRIGLSAASSISIDARFAEIRLASITLSTNVSRRLRRRDNRTAAHFVSHRQRVQLIGQMRAPVFHLRNATMESVATSTSSTPAFLAAAVEAASLIRRVSALPVLAASAAIFVQSRRVATHDRLHGRIGSSWWNPRHGLAFQNPFRCQSRQLKNGRVTQAADGREPASDWNGRRVSSAVCENSAAKGCRCNARQCSLRPRPRSNDNSIRK